MMRRLVLLGAAALALGGVASAAPSQSLSTVLGAPVWLNGHPKAADLRGKVVLLDVFTVDCDNCKNVTPNLQHVDATEKGKVVVIGIHSPETGAEKDRKYVVNSLAALGVTWPVAVDNDMKLWNAYGIGGWPTEMIFDRHGHLRKTVVGDSQDDIVNSEIDALLHE
jgi:thiol-disulfide isomerase/thioredoxin